MAEPSHRSQPNRPLLLRARVVLPIATPPVQDAGILIARGKIAGLGAWRTMVRGHNGPQLNLEDALVLPGLINAHCHLDYTHMAGLFPPPRHFTDWIKQITVTKQTWSDDEFRASWIAGAEMLLRTGTTTVADIEAVPGLLPALWQETPLRVFSFLELTGIRSRRDPRGILDEALQQIRKFPAGRCCAWLSPHAPYSTKPELLRLCAQTSHQRGWPMSTHVAESAPEYEMFRQRRGEMFGWLQRNERDMSDCGRISPVQHLHRNGALGPHLLAIHANHLARGDAALLAATGTHVVHCPHSHSYFKHRAFPYPSLRHAGVNICLGTDSLASTSQSHKTPAPLSLFAEMNQFASRHPRVGPATILRMVTVNAARALGKTGRLGELTVGAEADLVAIPYQGHRRAAPRAVISHTGKVLASMIQGRWAIPPAST